MNTIAEALLDNAKGRYELHLKTCEACALAEATGANGARCTRGTLMKRLVDEKQKIVEQT